MEDHIVIDFPFNVEENLIKELRRAIESLSRRSHITSLKVVLNSKWRVSIESIICNFFGKKVSVYVEYDESVRLDKIKVFYKKEKNHFKKHCHANGKDPLIDKHA